MIKKLLLVHCITFVLIMIFICTPFFIFIGATGIDSDQLHTDKDYTQSAYGFMNPLEIIDITNDWGQYSAIEDYAKHPAVDLACSVGDPIVAPSSGTVYQSGFGWDLYGAMTLWLRIDKDPNMTILYAHVSKVYAQKGDTVKQGQVIAECGSTGISTGPHLHMQVQSRGVPVNPHNYFKLLP